MKNKFKLVSIVSLTALLPKMNNFLKKALKDFAITNQDRKANVIYIIVAMLAGLLRITYGITYGWDQNLLSDYFWYKSIGQNIRNFTPLVDPYTGHVSALHPPAFAFVLAIEDFFSLSSIHQQLFVFILINWVLVFLLFRLYKILFSQEVALIAFALAAIDPRLIFIGAIIGPQPFYLCLVVVDLMVANVIIKNGYSHKRAAYLGILLGISVLTRTDAVIFGLLLITYLVKQSFKTIKEQVKKALIIVGCGLLIILPWSLRNTIDLHAFVPVSTSVGTILSQNNCKFSYYDISTMGIKSSFCGNIFYSDQHLTETQMNLKLTLRALNYIKSHFSRYFLVAIVRVLRPFGLYHFDSEIRSSNISSYSSFRVNSPLYNLNSAIIWAGFIFEWVMFYFAYLGYKILSKLDKKQDSWLILIPLIYCLVIMFFLNSSISTSTICDITLLGLGSAFLNSAISYLGSQKNLRQHFGHLLHFRINSRARQLKSE